MAEQTFARVYSAEQRDAIRHAWGDLGIRPAQRIADMAAAGTLADPAGVRLAPFNVPASTVREFGRKYLRRRAGLERKARLAANPTDALEQLRARLVCALDAELDDLERAQRSPRAVPNAGERIRACARAAREIAAIPDPTRGPSPTASTPHERSALARQILRSDASSAPSTDLPIDSSADV